MKIVIFRDYIVPLVLFGKKTSTWRLVDDKGHSVGDEIELRKFGRDASFAKAKITEVIEKPSGDLTAVDLEGHKIYKTNLMM